MEGTNKFQITDVQHARAIIKAVGEPYQFLVSDKLRSLFYNISDSEDDKNSQKVISNMEKEYVLNIANILWVDKYDKIPRYLKDW